MIKYTMTIEETPDGVVFNSNCEKEGASDNECFVARILSNIMHEAFELLAHPQFGKEFLKRGPKEFVKTTFDREFPDGLPQAIKNLNFRN